jgi:hypothetical protein
MTTNIHSFYLCSCFTNSVFASDSDVDLGFANFLVDVAGVPGVPASASFFALSLLLRLLLLLVSLLLLGSL